MPMNHVRNEIYLSGNLNEQFNMNEVKTCVEKNAESFASTVVLNFKDVPRANSCGIATLLKVLSELKKSVHFVHCPAWLVDQLNQIDEFFQISLEVKSVYAPYMDPSANEYTMRLIEISPGFFGSSEFENIETYVNDSGQTLSADFDKDDYFFFCQNLKQKKVS